MEAAWKKIFEERAKTKAELRAFEAEKTRLQSARQEEAARPEDEGQRRAAQATAAAMEEVEKKIKRQTPPKGSCADTEKYRDLA